MKHIEQRDSDCSDGTAAAVPVDFATTSRERPRALPLFGPPRVVLKTSTVAWIEDGSPSPPLPSRTRLLRRVLKNKPLRHSFMAGPESRHLPLSLDVNRAEP